MENTALQNIFSGLPTELIAGLIGSALTFLFGWLYRAWHERRGAFTGEWEQCIFTSLENQREGAQPVKHDRVMIRHSGGTIRADLNRLAPEDQNERAWHFVGRFTNGQIYGHFWSRNPADPSFGTILLRQRELNCFQGFYLKGKTRADGWDKDVAQMQVIPLEWRRCAHNGAAARSQTAN